MHLQRARFPSVIFIFLQFVALVGFALAAISESDCPPKCACDNDIVDCSSRGLGVIPKGIPMQTVYLTLRGNNVTVIPAGAFSHLHMLRELHLMDSHVTTLEPGAFEGLWSLEGLHLEDNELNTLQPGTFKGLTVEKLNLDGNPLSDLNPGAFANSSVEELGLSGCNLRIFSDRVFEDLKQSLRSLHVMDSTVPLSDLPPGLFAGFNLRDLSLGGLELTNTLFLSGSVIESLSLQRMPLGDKVWEVLPEKCSYLYLEDIDMNYLDTIPPINELRSLSLANNHLEILNLAVFVNNKDIMNLNVRNNSLKYIRSRFRDYLPQLRILDLGKNDLIAIEPRTYAGLPLDFLSLEENGIQTLSEGFYTIFQRITNVYLTSNPFHCSCKLLWLYKWMKRREYGQPMVWDVKCDWPFVGDLTSMEESSLPCNPINVNIHTAPSSIAIGGNVTITCMSQAHPEPVITLIGPNGITQNLTNIKYDEKNQEKSVELQIRGFKCRDVGVYACSATNSAGTSLNYSIILTHDHNCSSLLNAASNALRSNEVPPFGEAEDLEDLPSPFPTTVFVIAAISVLAAGLMTGFIVAGCLWYNKRRKHYILTEERVVEVAVISTVCNGRNDDVLY